MVLNEMFSNIVLSCHQHQIKLLRSYQEGISGGAIENAESFHQWYETDTILDVKRFVNKTSWTSRRLKVEIEGVTGSDDLDQERTLNSYKGQAIFNNHGEMIIHVKLGILGACAGY